VGSPPTHHYGTYGTPEINAALMAAMGLTEIVGAGEDLGTQIGLTINPKSCDALFADSMRDYFAMAHYYGARTMMHSRGSVRGMIDRLIDLGLDILEVVPIDAAVMDIAARHRDYHRRIAFCGSISVQHTLPEARSSSSATRSACANASLPRGA
jgi:hypothetical protein